MSVGIALFIGFLFFVCVPAGTMWPNQLLATPLSFLVPCSPCCVGLARRLQSNCCLVSYRRGERVSAASTESLPYDLVQNHCQAQVPSPFSWPCEHSPVSPSGPPLGCGTLDLPDAQFWAYRTSSVYPELSVLEVRFVCVIFIKWFSLDDLL